jgi:hypothetical protein
MLHATGDKTTGEVGKITLFANSDPPSDPSTAAKTPLCATCNRSLQDTYNVRDHAQRQTSLRKTPLENVSSVSSADARMRQPMKDADHIGVWQRLENDKLHATGDTHTGDVGN